MLERSLAAEARACLEDFPAVLLIGARQVGKSTFVQQLVDGGVLASSITLDDLATLEAAKDDPDGFVIRLEEPAAIDEIQRVPDLLRALKRTIDKDRRPGRFFLTGSANVLAQRGTKESLAGRLAVLELDGLSCAETDGDSDRSSLVSTLLDAAAPKTFLPLLRKRAAAAKKLSRASLFERVFFGGFPEPALKRKTAFAQRWFSSYLTSYLERDVRDLARIPDLVPFGRLLRLVGLRTGAQQNAKSLGLDAGLDQRTAAKYLDLLDVTFQLIRLAPWSAEVDKRLARTPKNYLRDSGLACHFQGVPEPAALGQHPHLDPLLETWFFAELRKSLARCRDVEVSCYRTHLGKEVDFVFERGSAALGIELKPVTGVTAEDFAGLRDMQDAMDGKALGLLAYLGDEVVPFSDSLAAVPLAAVV